MNSIRLAVLLVIACSFGCASQQPPLADPDADGRYSTVGVDGLRLAAKGEFVGEDQVQLRVDIVITATGDPPRTIASPSVITTVGEDAVVQVQGNGEDVVCSIAARRDGSGVIVTVTAVVGRGNTPIGRPTLRFRLP